MPFSASSVSTVVRIHGDATRLNQSITKIDSKFGKLAKAGGVAAVAITAAFAKSVEEFAKFEHKMNEVATLVDNKFDLTKVTSESKKLAAQYGPDATQQAAAFYQAISAGATDAAKATEIVRVANQLAIGGATTLDNAIDGLTTAVNAYGVELEDIQGVSDSFFTGMRLGKTTIGEISSNMGQIAGIAANAGIGLKEVLAAISTLTANGVPTETAIIQIRQALISILKPSQGAATYAKLLGIGFDATALKSKGLIGVLRDIYDAGAANSKMLPKLFGNVRALAAATTLASNRAERFSRDLEEQKNSTGATARATALTINGLSNTWDQLGSAVKNVLITMGAGFADTLNLSYVFRWWANQIQGLIDGTSELSKAIKFFSGYSAAKAVFQGVGDYFSKSATDRINEAVGQRPGKSTAVAPATKTAKRSQVEGPMLGPQPSKEFMDAAANAKIAAVEAEIARREEEKKKAEAAAAAKKKARERAIAEAREAREAYKAEIRRRDTELSITSVLSATESDEELVAAMNTLLSKYPQNLEMQDMIIEKARQVRDARIQSLNDQIDREFAHQQSVEQAEEAKRRAREKSAKQEAQDAERLAALRQRNFERAAKEAAASARAQQVAYANLATTSISGFEAIASAAIYAGRSGQSSSKAAASATIGAVRAIIPALLSEGALKAFVGSAKVPIVGVALGAAAASAALGIMQGLIQMHSGGAVTDATPGRLPGMSINERLAVLQTGERVLSPRQNRQYEQGMRGNSGNVVINQNVGYLAPPTRVQMDRINRDTISVSNQRLRRLQISGA